MQTKIEIGDVPPGVELKLMVTTPDGTQVYETLDTTNTVAGSGEMGLAGDLVANHSFFLPYRQALFGQEDFQDLGKGLSSTRHYLFRL